MFPHLYLVFPPYLSSPILFLIILYASPSFSLTSIIILLEIFLLFFLPPNLFSFILFLKIILYASPPSFSLTSFHFNALPLLSVQFQCPTTEFQHFTFHSIVSTHYILISVQFQYLTKQQIVQFQGMCFFQFIFNTLPHRWFSFNTGITTYFQLSTLPLGIDLII